MARLSSRALRLSRLSLLFAGATLVTSCQRKAPGPDECLALAKRTFGVHQDAELALPGVQENVDELTVECLLTPYDRELLACAEQLGTLRPCLRAFAARHGGVELGPDRARTPRRRRRESPLP